LDVFELRHRVIEDFRDYVRRFVVVRDDRIRSLVDREMAISTGSGGTFDGDRRPQGSSSYEDATRNYTQCR